MKMTRFELGWMNSRCAEKPSRLGGRLIPVAVWSLTTVTRLAAGQFEEAWKRTENLTSPKGLAVDGHGSVVLTAYTGAGAVVLKYSSDGRLLWRDTFGNGATTFLHQAIADADGNAWITGIDRTTNAAGAPSVFLRKYDPAGVVLWHRGFYDPGLPDYLAPARVLTADGSVVIAGTRRLNGLPAIQDDFFLIKYSGAGDVVWSRHQPLPAGYYAGSPALALDRAGNVVLSSYGYGLRGVSEFLTYQFGPDGVLKWVAEDDWDLSSNFTSGLAVDAAGSVYVAGNSPINGHSAARIIKYSSSGLLLWTRTVSAEHYFEMLARSVVVDAAGHAILALEETLPSFPGSDDSPQKDSVLVAFDEAGQELWISRSAHARPAGLAAREGHYFQTLRPEYNGPGERGRLQATSSGGHRLSEFNLADEWESALEVDPEGNLIVLGWNANGVVLRKFRVPSFESRPQATVTPRVSEVALGTGAVFESHLLPTGEVGYQWLNFGVPMAGETKARLVVPPSTVPNFRANYAVQVSNFLGATISPEVRFRVHLPPTFGRTGQTNSLPQGRPLLWNSEGGGELPLAFQWWFGDQPLLGETRGTLEFSSVEPHKAGRYTLVASNAWGVATQGPYLLSVEPNSPFDAWRWRHPRPQGNDLRGAASGGGHFVAIGHLGTLIGSEDGLHWESRQQEGLGDLNDVIFAGELFVAVGGNGKILTSSDGTQWQQRGPGGLVTVNAVAYGNGIWVAVGDAFLVSTNGMDWAVRPPNGHGASDIAFGAGRFVVCNIGNAAPAMTSVDGRTWTSINFRGPAPAANGRSRVTYGAGRFVIVNRSNTFVSTDGLEWQAVTSDTTRRFNDVAADQGHFVAVGTSGGGTDAERSRVFNSEDGLHWTTNNLALDNNLHRVVRVTDRYLAMGDDGNILYSTDGLGWTVIARGNDRNLNAVAVAGERAVAVGESGQILISDSGSAWLPVTSGTSNELVAVAHGAGHFVALAETGEIHASTDGSTWRSVHRSAQKLRRLLYADARFVAIGDKGTILSSVDGNTWVQRLSRSSYDLHAVAHGIGLFVVAGDLQAVLTSPDGFEWAAHSGPIAGYPAGIAFGNGVFVATGVFTGAGVSTVAFSADGRHWEQQADPVTYPLGPLQFMEGHFVAPGDRGRIYTSVDGRHWLEHFVGCENSLNGFARTSKGTVLVVGNNQAILESSPFHPTLELSGLASGITQLNLRGYPGRSHRLQATSELGLNRWEDLGSLILPWPGTNWLAPAANPHRFYRLVTP